MEPYKPSQHLSFVIESDGDSWFAHYNEFTNVQESDEVEFGKTPQEALQKFIGKHGERELYRRIAVSGAELEAELNKGVGERDE